MNGSYKCVSGMHTFDLDSDELGQRVVSSRLGSPAAAARRPADIEPSHKGNPAALYKRGSILVGLCPQALSAD